MPTSAMIEGISCTIEKLPDGRIRVRHASAAFNPMHGADTGGLVEYFVHACQRNQFHLLNSHLPEGEQAQPESATADKPPWWSLSEGERGGMKE